MMLWNVSGNADDNLALSSRGEVRTSAVTGKVLFKGTPPKPRRIRIDADPNCRGEIFSEEVVVNLVG